MEERKPKKKSHETSIFFHEMCQKRIGFVRCECGGGEGERDPTLERRTNSLRFFVLFLSPSAFIFPLSRFSLKYFVWLEKKKRRASKSALKNSTRKRERERRTDRKREAETKDNLRKKKISPAKGKRRTAG